MISSLEDAQLRNAVYELEAKVPRTEADLESSQREYASLRAKVAALQADASRAAGDEQNGRTATSQRRLLETDLRY